MKQERFTLVAFGDSITAAGEVAIEHRWTTLLESHWNNRHPEYAVTVVNAGVGGNTSCEGLERSQESVLSWHPAVVLVEFGGNDATDDMGRHVPPEEFLANLEAMRARICDTAGAGMILLTFPPVINDWHAWRDHPCHAPYGGADEHIEVYRRLTRDFALTRHVPCIDIDRRLREACRLDGAARHIMPDGVHLTIEGHRVTADEILSNSALIHDGIYRQVSRARHWE